VNDDADADPNDEWFRRQMADVRPLKTPPRVVPAAPRPAPRPRREADKAIASSTPANRFVERPQADRPGAEESLFHHRGGLQKRLLRQLKRGDLRPEARLDLHGHTIDAAGQALDGFLRRAGRHGWRCVLIVHGKGHRSAHGQPALKAQVNHWLRDDPAVLAFASARPRDGGAGALYVLLHRQR